MAKPRPKAPSKKAAAPSRKAAPAKKKAIPARKTVPAGKTAPAKKAAAAEKTKLIKKAPPAKKPAAARKAKPVKKAPPAKKPAAAKKAMPSKKAEPVHKPKPAVKPAARRTAADDPALAAFTKALQAFHQKSWGEAAELFERTLAESDQLDLSARARQYLAVCQQRLAEAGGSKTKKKDEDADPFLRAVFERNRGNLSGALDLCRKEGRDQKDERFAYLAASIHAAEGRMDEALQALSQAIELNPKNRIHAFHDPDFTELRKNRDQRQLFGLS